MGVINSSVYPFLDINDGEISINVRLPIDNYRPMVRHFCENGWKKKLEDYVETLEGELKINELKIKLKWDEDLGLQCISYESTYRLCLNEREMSYEGGKIPIDHAIPLYLIATRYIAMLFEAMNSKRKRGIQVI